MDAATAEWLQRLRQGDRMAFNDLVRRLHGKVFQFAHRMVRNPADAQEVAQDTFLAAFESLHTFEGRSAIETWLLAIAYRKACDRLKAAGAEMWESFAAFEESKLWRDAHSVQNITDWSRTPELIYEQAEAQRRIEAALARLPAEARALFELRELQGMTMREAAAVLGISEGAARVRLHRTRQFILAELRGTP